jgi:GNAT superfamily N-acetyltransferase
VTAAEAAVEVRRAAADGPESVALLDLYLEHLRDRVGADFEFASPNAAPATVEQFGPRSGGGWLIVHSAGEAVACGGYRRLDEHTCEIKRMFVAPHARGRGHARRLLAELERAAREDGYELVRLDTSARLPESRRLYESSGYAAIDRYNENQWAHHWFEKRL